MFGDDNVVMISARNFTPPQAKAHLGNNHHYFSQTEIEVEAVCTALGNIANLIIARSVEAILYVPQCANFYGRTLIESELIYSFFYYDEGDAAYDPHFSMLQSQRWNAGLVRNEKALKKHFEDFGISRSIVSTIYRNGPTFYELSHPKLAGFVSLFRSAFPGCKPVIIPIKKPENKKPLDFLFIVPELNKGFSEESGLVSFIQLASSAAGENQISQLEIVVKYHPNDHQQVRNFGNRTFNALGFHVIDYYEHCKEHQIDPYREPGFLATRKFIGPNNSTTRYRAMLGELDLS